MEENKYYTPTIEEFHVGFEYEAYEMVENRKLIRIPEIWNWNIHIFDQKKSLSTIQGLIKKDCIRVKYLDKQDIEELGWNFRNRRGIDREYFKTGEFVLSMGPENCNKLVIEDDSGDVFRGTIKNKSELKQLMTQLSIK